MRGVRGTHVLGANRPTTAGATLSSRARQLTPEAPERPRSRLLRPSIALGLLALLGAAPASAQTGGAAAAPSTARISSVTCVPTKAAPCAAEGILVRGGRVRITGARLAGAQAVVFRGSRSARDDVRVAARHVDAKHLEAAVPRRARSGPLAVVVGRSAISRTAPRVRVGSPAPPAAVTEPAAGAFLLGGAVRPGVRVEAARAGRLSVEVVGSAGTPVGSFTAAVPAGASEVTWDGRLGGTAVPTGTYVLRVAADQPASGASAPFALLDHLFPIRGTHDLGQTTTNDFGGGRGHQGQDLFAACGTPLAAAQGGTVRAAGTDGRAGNHIVITGLDGEDHVYMHMQAPPALKPGDRVLTGQPIGAVGDSGNADGCHLHFELWTAPGWYAGGTAYDPLPALRAWDGWS